jgi:hypothetical protein
VRITREGGRVFLRDQAALFWALGIFLSAGGTLAIAMSLGLAENADELKPWERLAGAAVGLGVFAGGMWWLAQNPSTKVELDRTRRSLRLVRWGILGREVRALRFDELESVVAEETEDGDGGKVWRPAVRLRSGGVLPLSLLWSHNEPGIRSAVATVTEVCGL